MYEALLELDGRNKPFKEALEQSFNNEETKEPLNKEHKRLGLPCTEENIKKIFASTLIMIIAEIQGRKIDTEE